MPLLAMHALVRPARSTDGIGAFNTHLPRALVAPDFGAGPEQVQSRGGLAKTLVEIQPVVITASGVSGADAQASQGVGTPPCAIDADCPAAFTCEPVEIPRVPVAQACDRPEIGGLAEAILPKR